MKIIKWGFVLLLIYMTGLLVSGADYLFIDNSNLFIHEVGHFIFMYFGSTLSFLGGTIMQLLVPIICGLILIIRQGSWFSAGFCLWWLGENLVNIGRYMKDASLQLLPLIGGGIHDWAYLFGKWGIIGQSQIIGQIVKVLGMVIMGIAISWMIGQLLIGDR